jgi:hypothetical protein
LRTCSPRSAVWTSFNTVALTMNKSVSGHIALKKCANHFWPDRKTLKYRCRQNVAGLASPLREDAYSSIVDVDGYSLPGFLSFTGGSLKCPIRTSK